MLTHTATSSSALPGWFLPAMQSAERACTSRQGPLAERMAHARMRLARMNGATSIAGALTASVATPGIALLEALRVDYGIAADDPRVVAVGEGMLLLYFFLRVQDDIVDEPEAIDRGYVYVAQLFWGASLRAFACALGGSPEFFSFHEQTMAAFADTAAWEIDVVRAGSASSGDVERLGQKFLPIAVPLGAVALLANHPGDLDDLVRFSQRFGTGLQLINDVLNIKEDHEQRRTTPVLRWIYHGGAIAPTTPAAQVRISLLSDPALGRACRAAEHALNHAAQLAREIGAPRLAAVALERAAYAREVPGRLLSLYLTGGLA
jgi:hypothetical protein